jgi:pimeloyl-ACP methyl ester carboxylesterase
VRWFLSNFLLADRRRLTPTMVEAYLTCTQHPQAQYAALASLSGVISFDLANYIGQLSLPTVVVLGQKSRFLPPAVVRRLASLNPRAITAIHEIPDAGVLPHLERPEAVVGPLRDFASQILTQP